MTSELGSIDQNCTEQSTEVSKLRDDLLESRELEKTLIAALEKKDREIKRLRREKEQLEDNFESNLSKALTRKETELRDLMLKHEKIMTILIGKKK